MFRTFYFVLLLLIALTIPLILADNASLLLKIPILTYHQIRTPQKGDDLIFTDLSCPENLFLAHLAYLQKAGYHTITFRDLSAYFTTGKALPTRPIILTFDDGALNTMTAFDALRNRNMKGVFFVTNYLGDSYHLSEANLKKIVAADMEIGSHTKSHFGLTKVSSRIAEMEIRENKERIETITGIPVISFCYPSGDFNSRIIELLQAYQFQFARTTIPGISTITSHNYQLKTIKIHHYTTHEMIQRSIDFYIGKW